MNELFHSCIHLDIDKALCILIYRLTCEYIWLVSIKMVQYISPCDCIYNTLEDTIYIIQENCPVSSSF
jgi:hypothetical protein